MEEQYIENNIENSVKKRLILAGLRELEEHGFRDFSLRRVALAAQVSCAAPYRHFKDKDELIFGVISYVAEDYELLAKQISEVFCEKPKEHIIQLAAASFRFWLANGNLRTVMPEWAVSGGTHMLSELCRFDAPVYSAVSGLVPNGGEELSFTVLSLVYGAVDLVSSGRFSAEKALSYLQRELDRLLTLGRGQNRF